MATKKPAALAITSSDAATTALARYGALERDIARVESDLAEEVARLREAADLALAPLQTELTATLLGLQAFAKRTRPTLPAGQKTIRLSTGDLGWRIGNTAVSLKVKVGTILARIKALGEEHTKKYIRTKETLDRPALLRDRPAIDGITYAPGRERFYVTARTETSEARAVVDPH